MLNAERFFYPDTNIYRLDGRPNAERYRLAPFDFNRQRECLEAASPNKLS